MNIFPEKIISDHHFNYGLDLVIPGVDEIPSSIVSELKQQHAYKIQSLPLVSLLDEDFIDAFVRRGPLYMMSSNTRVDSDNCAVLIPPGILFLSLTKDTYQQLGLIGKCSEASSKVKTDRYVVDIPLSAAYFKPGKKLHDRVVAALGERLNLKFDFLVTWSPEDPNVCSSSIKHYFDNVRGQSVEEIDLSTVVQQLRDVKLPVVRPESMQGSVVEDAVDPNLFLEWLGGLNCEIDFAKGADDFVSSVSVPDPTMSAASCLLCQYRGFITPQNIATIGEVLREYVTGQKGGGSAPWVAMTVHGFQDSPVTWGTQENVHKAGGSNFYTLVFHQGKHCWAYRGNDYSPVQFQNFVS